MKHSPEDRAFDRPRTARSILRFPQRWRKQAYNEVSPADRKHAFPTHDAGVWAPSIAERDRGFESGSLQRRVTPVRLGYDLDTLEGNADFALWPYEKEGSQPLESSRPARERRRQH